jgi:glycolate oxidase FAD binding subunit
VSARPDPARYALGGVAPREVARPGTAAEAAEVLRAAAREGRTVLPWGGGVGLARATAPARYDMALDLTALDAVVACAPDDLTLTAGVGATLAALRAAVAAHGLELPLEAARAERATLGGILAANASGPRRARLGSPRDRILGAQFALGDGALARSGGRVVKNVAGYALHRLLCGSRGGLGVLLEATLKLEPAPPRRLALVHGAGAKALRDPARWTALLALEPAVLSAVGGGLARALPVASPTDPVTVIVGLEDDAARVDQQAAALMELLGEPDARLEDEAVADLWQSLADLEEHEGATACGRLTFTGGGAPAATLAPLLDGDAPPTPWLLHAPAGRLHVLPAAADAAALATSLSAAGLTLIEAAGLPAPEPFLPPPAAALELRARVRAALDPNGTLAGGWRWEHDV